MEKAKEVCAVQIDADGNGVMEDKVGNQDREMEDDLEPANHINQKWPMRPPKLELSSNELDDSVSKRPKKNSLTGGETSRSMSSEWASEVTIMRIYRYINEITILIQTAVSGMYPYGMYPYTWGFQYYPVPVVYAPVYHPGYMSPQMTSASPSPRSSP